MRCWLWGWVALLHCSAVLAADQFAVGPPPNWVKDVRIDPAREPADEAPAKELLFDTQLNLERSREEVYFRSLTRIQASQGLSVAGMVTIPWNPATDVLTIHKLNILRGGQTIDALSGGRDITVLRREKSLEYATLNGVLTAVAEPGGLRVGDTLELAYSIKRSNPVLPEVAEWTLNPATPLSVAHVRLRARWADSAGVRWRPSDTLKGMTETHHGGVTEVSGAYDNFRPLPPVAKRAPPRYAIGPQAQFSNLRSWTQIADLMNPLFAHAAILSPQSALNAEIERIRASTSDPGERAMAALTLVQDEVRYVALAMDEGALVPTDADTTWSRRFGDCKGKTVLLLALLHALDIEAVPVLVNTLHGDSVQSGLPMMAAFNHVLVRAVIGHKEYWLDGTNSGDRELDALYVPAYYWGLPLMPEADLVAITPTAPNRPTTEAHLEIDARKGIEGPLPLHGEAVIYGRLAAQMRFGINGLPVADRDRLLCQFWSKIFRSFTPDKVSARFDEASAAEILTMDGTVTLDWSMGRYPVPGPTALLASADRAAGADTGVPYMLDFPEHGLTVRTIKLPHTKLPFTLEGEDFDHTIAGIEIRRRTHLGGDVFTAEESVRTLVPEISGSDLDSNRGRLRNPWIPPLYLVPPAELLQGKTTSAAKLPPVGSEKEQQLLMAGIQAVSRHEYDQALEKFNAALELDPRSAKALANRGVAYVWKAMAVPARQDFGAAYTIDPHEPLVSYGRGLMALGARNMNEAVKEFTQSLEDDPGNANACYYRALAYGSLGEIDKAIADARQAIDLRPDGVVYYTYHAELMRRQGRIDESLKDAAWAIEANPTDPYAYVEAAKIDASSGNRSEAMAALDRSLALRATVVGYVERAAYRPRTDTRKRISDLSAALAIEPKSKATLLALALAQSDAKEYKQAVATLSTAIDVLGGTSELFAYRAAVYAKSGQKDLAEQDISSARAKAAASSKELSQVCWILAFSNVELEAALSSCDAALQASQALMTAHESRAFALLRLGRYAESVGEFDIGLRKNPDNSMSLYGRGLARRLNGDTASGDADLKLAVSLDANTAVQLANFGMAP